MELQQLSLDRNKSHSDQTSGFKAGRLKKQLSEWQKITSDKNILHFISQCDIEFKDNIVPYQHSIL